MDNVPRKPKKKSLFDRAAQPADGAIPRGVGVRGHRAGPERDVMILKLISRALSCDRVDLKIGQGAFGIAGQESMLVSSIQ